MNLRIRLSSDVFVVNDVPTVIVTYAVGESMHVCTPWGQVARGGGERQGGEVGAAAEGLGEDPLLPAR